MKSLALSLAFIFCVASPAVLAQATSSEDGASLEHRVHVQFSAMPATWTVAQQVMDTIWQPLGLRGVNHYAYGKAVPPHTYAARSDPQSELYQAWFGVYTVVGDSAFRLASGKNYAIRSVMKLAEYDQRSWLEAMGDPRPLANADTTVDMQKIMIDGVERTVCLFHMQTHSDLSPGVTPLAHYIGMPGATARLNLPSYHDLSLHGYYAFWYDQKRNATIIVYAASSAFLPSTVLPRGRHSPVLDDNGVALDKQFHEMMRGVHIVDASPGK
jgi:hypothetical protein